jgi:hypothetical protein
VSQATGVQPARYVRERVDVGCGRCGLPYEVSARQRRRIENGETAALCPLCRYRERHPPDEDERSWWLRRFTDAEIAQMATVLFGSGSAESVSRWRERLLGAGNERAGPKRSRRPRLDRPSLNRSRGSLSR